VRRLLDRPAKLTMLADVWGWVISAALTVGPLPLWASRRSPRPLLVLSGNAAACGTEWTLIHNKHPVRERLDANRFLRISSFMFHNFTRERLLLARSGHSTKRGVRKVPLPEVARLIRSPRRRARAALAES
jgi:hypothetical protein